jgi:hypothetical protein
MVALHQVEIEGLAGLPPSHEAAVRLLPDVRLIKELRQYNAGLSGAYVYLVYVHDAASKPYLCILKVAEQAEINREALYSRRAREALIKCERGDAIPQVIRESLHPEASAGIRAVLLQLAHDDALETQPLLDYLQDQSELLDECLNSIADLLLAWNVPEERSHHVEMLTPAQALRRLFSIGHDDLNAPKRRLQETGDRLLRGGIKARHLEKSIEISFQGNNLKLPNPLYYAAEGFNDDGFSGAQLDIPFIMGGVHGDVHSGNILFNKRSPYAQPTLIDFAKGGEEKPIFFDWLYLEFDVLYRMMRLVDDTDWKQWMQLIQVITQLNEDPAHKPYVALDLSRLSIPQQRVARTVMTLRQRMADYWKASHATISNLLSVGFWLCGCYVGLNYARKDTEAPTPTVTLMKYAALYYAACCLQRFFDVAMVDPLEMDGGSSVGLGPHRCLFFQGIDSLNGDRSGIYLSSTEDHLPNLRLFYQYDPDQFKPRVDKAHEPDELLQKMRTTKHFLCIIGREPESVLLRDGVRRIPPTVFECEAAIAHFSRLQDRWVLIDELARGHLERSNHPIMRGDGTNYPDFVVESFADEKTLRNKVRVAGLRWQQDDGLALFDTEKLPTLYSDLQWEGLTQALNRSSGGSVQVMKLTGLPEDIPPSLFWAWLLARVKDTYGLRSAELVKIEDNPMFPGFIHHLYSAIFRGSPPPIMNEAEIPDKVLEKLKQTLERRNLCLLICNLGGHHEELMAFCQQLSEALAAHSTPYRLTIVIEDQPLPNVPELRMSDMMIKRSDFGDVLLDNDEGYMWNFVRGAVKWIETPDWESVLFGDQDSVSPVQFLQNFAQYVRGLVQQDLS